MRLFYAGNVNPPGSRHRSRPVLQLILYQRDVCHLCDLALEVMAQARAPQFDSVFIDHDAQLEGTYGVRVPVLRDQASGVELDWPFDAARLRTWLTCLP